MQPRSRSFGSTSSVELRAWAARWEAILHRGWGGGVNAEFPHPPYWRRFYESAAERSGCATFEWGAGGEGLAVQRLAARLRRASPAAPVKALHAGCGTSALGAALAAQGWQVTNCDFCEEAVGTLAELESLGLLSCARRGGGRSEYAVGDILAPPAAWHGAFDVVVEKGLSDTILFGDGPDAALDRAVRYAAAVDALLRPGGCLLQASDAPTDMRLEMLRAAWARSGSWRVEVHPTGAGPLTVLVAQKASS